MRCSYVNVMEYVFSVIIKGIVLPQMLMIIVPVKEHIVFEHGAFNYKQKIVV